MISTEKAFQLYFATKLHFTTEYDVFSASGRFSGKSKIASRNDLELINVFLRQVETERGIIELTASNMLYGYTDFLYNDPDDGLKNYSHWNMVKKSMTHVLERDLSYIGSLIDSGVCDSIDAFFQKKFVSAILSQKIDYETTMLVDRKIPVIEHIGGFDGGKYIARMRKAKLFVTKGILAEKHSSHIDDFLKKYKKKVENYDNSVRTPQIPCFDIC